MLWRPPRRRHSTSRRPSIRRQNSRRLSRIERLEDRRLLAAFYEEIDKMFIGPSGQSAYISGVYAAPDQEGASRTVTIGGSGPIHQFLDVGGTLALTPDRWDVSVTLEPGGDASFASFNVSVKPYSEVSGVPENENWILGARITVSETLRIPGQEIVGETTVYSIYRFVSALSGESLETYGWDAVVLPAVAPGGESYAYVNLKTSSRSSLGMTVNGSDSFSYEPGSASHGIRYKRPADSVGSQGDSANLPFTRRLNHVASLRAVVARGEFFADLVGDGFDLQGNANSFHWGESLTINYRVINQGEAIAPASTSEFFFSTDGVIDSGSDLSMTSASIPELAPGEFYEGQIDVSLPESVPDGLQDPANVTLGMFADSADVVPESDREANNLNQGLGIDLANLQVSIASDPDPDPPLAGTFDFVAQAVREYADSNEGGGFELVYELVTTAAQTPAVTLALFWATGAALGTRRGTAAYSALSETNNGQYTLRVPGDQITTQDVDAWHLHFVIDPDNSETERNEGNNWVSLSPQNANVSHELFEYLAREIVYRDGSDFSGLQDHVGQFVSQLPQQSHAEMVRGWRVQQVWAGTSGLYTSVFTSPNQDPIMVFRGTDFESPLDWLSNFGAEGIGYTQFQELRSDILQWLGDFSNVSFVGHSLGGALAQWFAAEATAGEGMRIGEVVTFNSPGIKAQTAQSFRPSLAGDVMHYVVNGDIVSMAGEGFLEGNYKRFNYEEPGYLGWVINFHTKPLLLDHLFSAPDQRVERPQFTINESIKTTGWLNSPLYFHSNPKFLLFLTGLNGGTALGNRKLGPQQQIPLILFRQTFEESRVQFAGFLDYLRDNHIGRQTFSNNPQFISFGVPKINFQVGSYFKAEMNDMRVTYNASQSSLKLQGTIELAGFYGDAKVVGNFAGQNFLRLNAPPSGQKFSLSDLWDLVGKLELREFALKGGWKVKEGILEIDTIQNEVAIGAVLVMPGGVEIEAKAEMLNFELNQILLAARGLSVPVAATGAFVRDIEGDLQHLAPSDPALTIFSGNTRLTYGPELSVAYPSWLGGGEIRGSLMNLDVKTTWDRRHMTGAAELDVMFGLASGVGEMELNWTDGFVSAEGEFNALGGVATAAGSIRGDSDLNLVFGAEAVVQLPASNWNPFGEVQLQEGNLRIQYIHDQTLANDYIAVWGFINFFGRIPFGIRYSLDGNPDWIGGLDDLEPEPTSTQLLSSANINPSQSYTLGPDRDLVVLVLAHSDGSPITDYELRDPSGETFSRNQVVSSDSMQEVAELSSTDRVVIAISDPIPGRWIITDYSQPGSQPDFSAFEHLPSSSVSIDSVVRSGTGWKLEYSDTSIQGVPIHFYASSAPDDPSGIYLGSAQSGGSQFEWNKEIPPGKYYVYAVIDDGQTLPVGSVSNPIVVGPQPKHMDVNGDGFLTALDALLVINMMGRFGSTIELPLVGSPEMNEIQYFDVNRDNRISGLDALLVINRLDSVANSEVAPVFVNEIAPSVDSRLDDGLVDLAISSLF